MIPSPSNSLSQRERENLEFPLGSPSPSLMERGIGGEVIISNFQIFSIKEKVVFVARDDDFNINYFPFSFMEKKRGSKETTKG